MSPKPAVKKNENILSWKPNKGAQADAFSKFYVTEILYGGAKGGGKTDWLLFDFLEPSQMESPRYRGIILRRTYPRLSELIDRSLMYFSGFGNYDNAGKVWTFSSGAKLYFGHCQNEADKYNYQGKEYQYMGFDQLEEFTETMYEFLVMQCRTSDKSLRIRIRGTSNPGNVGHLFVKKKFIDGKEPMKIYRDEHGMTSIFIPAKVYDNPALMDSDPMYVKRLESLPEKERKAYLHGDWSVFAGQYFGEWDMTKHIIKPFVIPKDWHRFISGDYGFAAPSSVGWYAVSPERKIYRYKELYRERMTYKELAEEVCRMTGDDRIDYWVLDPAIFGDKQHHKVDVDSREGESGAELMQKIVNDIKGNDRFLLTRGDNRRVIGWGTVREFLKDGDDGTPNFQVFQNCVDFIRTFPALIHDEIKPEDVNTDGEDHAGDECRLALMSRPQVVPYAPKKVLSESSPAKYLQKRRQLEYA